MGITCKPIGKEKSVLKKLQNRIEAEEKAREETRRNKKKEEKNKN